MNFSHKAITQLGIDHHVDLDNLPDECPQCHKKGTFQPLRLYLNTNKRTDERLEVIYRCPNSSCYEVFIGFYTENSHGIFFLNRTEPEKYLSHEFSKTIKNISPEFAIIYNQALKAENDGLNQICGPGYRKALEFIIKDYLISKEEDPIIKEDIKKETLGGCIANRIKDLSIKEVAKRAAWLGNDETHYIRKWEQKDLQDLKRLIALTVHWMEAEALTEQLLEDMPDKKEID